MAGIRADLRLNLVQLFSVASRQSSSKAMVLGNDTLRFYKAHAFLRSTWGKLKTSYPPQW